MFTLSLPDITIRDICAIPQSSVMKPETVRSVVNFSNQINVHLQQGINLQQAMKNRHIFIFYKEISCPTDNVHYTI
jgi:hypothetical protein